VPTARLIADALGVPLTYMYCEDDKVAALLLALHKLKPGARDRKVAEWMVMVQHVNQHTHSSLHIGDYFLQRKS